MNAYNGNDEEFPAVAGSCKHMRFRNSLSGASEEYGGLSCSMCSNWDGTDCRKKVLNSLVSRYEYS